MTESSISQHTENSFRLENATMTGLSELSKQLQIQKAQNESISIEINRLERQLKIVADLQGITVSDLRQALDDACANEAFEEMQHRVAKLRADLEAASLIKEAELRKDVAAPQIATMEKRIKALEETEGKLRLENASLNDKLEQETRKISVLEAEVEDQKRLVENVKNQVQLEAIRVADNQEIEKLKARIRHLEEAEVIKAEETKRLDTLLDQRTGRLRKTEAELGQYKEYIESVKSGIDRCNKRFEITS